MTNPNAKYTDPIDPNPEKAYLGLNYAGAGNDLALQFGPECEFFLCKFDEDGHMQSLDHADAVKLMDEYKRRENKELCQEAVESHFELNFSPVTLDNFDSKMRRFMSQMKALYETATDLGFRVIPSSNPPHVDLDKDARSQLVKRDRIQIMLPRAEKMIGYGIVRFANGTAGIHVSNTYSTADQFFTDDRRCNYRSAFVQAAGDRSFSFWNGMKPTNGAVPRMKIAHDFSKEATGRTGIDPLFFSSLTGEERIKAILERTMNNPVFVYFDAEGKLHDICDLHEELGNPASFKSLADKLLNTASNLVNAGSCFWFGTKLQDIPVENPRNGKPYKRIEDRFWPAGTWQMPTAVLERMLPTTIPECGRDVDALYEDFGYHAQGPAYCEKTAHALKQATESAAYQGQLGLQFSMSTCGRFTAQDFGREYVRILRAHAKPYGLTDYFDPLAHIVENDQPDSKVLSELCQTPDDVARFVREYDIADMTDPHKSLSMLRDEGRFTKLER